MKSKLLFFPFFVALLAITNISVAQGAPVAKNISTRQVVHHRQHHRHHHYSHAMRRGGANRHHAYQGYRHRQEERRMAYRHHANRHGIHNHRDNRSNHPIERV